MTFADRLKNYRKELGLTQAGLAKVLEVPARTLWDWEKGRSIPLLITEEGAIHRLVKLRMNRLEAAQEDL